MLNNARSHGLWELTAPKAPETEALTSKIEVDVAVIGGGYTGLSAALYLAEGAADVALLEQVEIGFGGAGRNAGLVNAGMWVMPDTLTDVLGNHYGERLIRLLGGAPQLVFDLIEKHRIACEAEREGTLHCAVGSRGLEELKQRAAQWQRFGAPVSLLDAKETETKVGTSAYSGSLLDLRAGTIQPLAYARGLARAALDAGAQIFTRSKVIGAERVNDRWELKTATGSVSARWIVVATDVYTDGLWPEIRMEQVSLPYFSFATAQLSGNLRASILPGKQGAWDTNTVPSYFRFDRAGRLLFGSVGALRGSGAGIHRAWARRALRKLFPQIGDVSFEAEWYGRIGMTDDNLPRFHKLADNVVAFSGYNGRGIAPGTTFGRVLASYILGQIAEKDLPLPVSPVGKPVFRAAKEAFYEAGAQLVHLSGARL